MTKVRRSKLSKIPYFENDTLHSIPLCELYPEIMPEVLNFSNREFSLNIKDDIIIENISKDIALNLVSIRILLLISINGHVNDNNWLEIKESLLLGHFALEELAYKLLG